MSILLLGDASFVNATLRRGLKELGHDVTLMSDGNGWHDSQRDIDLRRDMRYGLFGGLKVLFTLLRNVRRLVGNDVVMMHNYQVVPLGMKCNMLLIGFIKRHNRHLVKLCLGDDPQVIERQLQGVPRYSDLYYNGCRQNVEANKERVAEQRLPQVVSCWRKATRQSELLLACLYEYYLNYDVAQFSEKLRYLPLPIMVSSVKNVRVKGVGAKIKVLIGIQAKRDYLKGAARIADMIDELDRREPGRLLVKRVHDVPYGEYCAMLEDADVLVDQFYSYTPSMNSLAAMARGTVVIGGGEEEFYDFIGEKELRPIINVSPELTDEENMRIISDALLTPGNVAALSRQSVAFVNKHHDYKKVAKAFIEMMEKL